MSGDRVVKFKRWFWWVPWSWRINIIAYDRPGRLIWNDKRHCFFPFMKYSSCLKPNLRSVVERMSNMERQDLVYFWTSSPALPASEEGFQPMPTITIRPADDAHLPTANTCISRLYIPLYRCWYAFVCIIKKAFVCDFCYLSVTSDTCLWLLTFVCDFCLQIRSKYKMRRHQNRWHPLLQPTSIICQGHMR